MQLEITTEESTNIVMHIMDTIQTMQSGVVDNMNQNVYQNVVVKVLVILKNMMSGVMKYKLKKELKDEAKQTRINTNKINISC